MPDDISREELWRLYDEEKLPLAKIAKMYGRTLKWAQVRMRQYNLPIRTRHESLRATWQKRGYTVNEQFFSEWSDEMAYVLGWFITDGCVRKDGHGVIMTLADEDVLTDIAAVMQHNPGIRTITQKTGRTYYSLEIHSPQIRQDLLSYGVTPQKTRTVMYPDVPDEVERHFVRGVLDGDGSVCRTKIGRLWIEIGKSSESFITNLRDAIYQHTGVYARIEEKTIKTGIHYRISYHRRDDLLTLYQWLYLNVPSNLRLERKYQRLVDVFGPIEEVVESDKSTMACVVK